MSAFGLYFPGIANRGCAGGCCLPGLLWVTDEFQPLSVSPRSGRLAARKSTVTSRRAGPNRPAKEERGLTTRRTRLFFPKATREKPSFIEASHDAERHATRSKCREALPVPQNAQGTVSSTNQTSQERTRALGSIKAHCRCQLLLDHLFDLADFLL